MRIKTKLKEWLFGAEEERLLSEIADHIKRNFDASTRIRTLESELATVRAERDRAVSSERASLQKITDLLSYRALGRPIFDLSAFENRIDEAVKSKVEEFRKSVGQRGSGIARKQRDEFLSQYDLVGIEPKFAEDVEEPAKGA